MRDRTRWIGMLMQPALYIALVGQGIAASMTFRQPPPGVAIDYVAFMYPGIVGMGVMFTAIFSAVSIIWDREFGFLKEVLVRAGAALGGGGRQGAGDLDRGRAPDRGPAGPGAARARAADGRERGRDAGRRRTDRVHARLPRIAIAGRMQTLEAFQLVMNVVTMPCSSCRGRCIRCGGCPAGSTRWRTRTR